MATQKIQSLVKNRTRLINRLLTTPANQLNAKELKLLNVALTFGDACYTKKVDLCTDNMYTRDLRSYHTARNWDELCSMLCMVDSYNEYDPVKVIEALAPHKGLIEYGEGGHTQFGREYSPVLYLDLKRSYDPKVKGQFIPKVKALAKDLKEIGLADELHWSLLGKRLDGGFDKEDFPFWRPTRDEAGEITGFEKENLDHFGTLRIWWD